ncbi:DUF2290 domain-containing protein [Bacillus toyonensis]|uniref:DUF2290 domain-containing protein n=1 Tax=Bacillus toyonensis TaxID=155322 RepID=UPI001483648F|nr:DUF2290 domain-containing protein [Bacillus toyonensis]
MTQKINQNVLAIKEQIDNSLNQLASLNIVRFYNPSNITNNKQDDTFRISWFNHVGGRNVSSNAFLHLNQYLAILESGAYHALMHDYSILRVSFTYQHSKLISQNLLWWPCPVKIDFEYEEEFTPFELVNDFLEDKNNYRMRSPIRIDFDIENDTEDHPKAHIHTQHPKSRMNTVEPICFNTFIRFILNHYYPEVDVDITKFPKCPISYPKVKEIKYILEEKLVLA